MKVKEKKTKTKASNATGVFNDFGLIRTICDDEEFARNESSGEEDKDIDFSVDPIVAKQRKKTAKQQEVNSTAVSFNDLDTSADHITARQRKQTWMDGTNAATNTRRTAALEEQIRKARLALVAARSEGHLTNEEDLENIFEQEFLHADEGHDDVVKTRRKKKKKNAHATEEKTDGEAEAAKREAFEVIDAKKLSEAPAFFSSMNLSRPLLRALTDSGFTRATPIQTACIPLAMAGRDICACAATGTGKTFAFMLPILERLLLRPSNAEKATRVLVLAPTRELAVQVYDVTRQLARYLTDLEMVVSAGGFDLKAQEAALRRRPEIVIATPGRLIDHLRNAPGFSLEHVEILVLDEADRMLDEFFAEQMKEIIRLCSPIRQTMLFSATMTEAVRDLAAVSLKNPVKVFVNTNAETGDNLSQEFIRIRPKREADREAILASLLSRTLRSESTVVFVQTKRLAHRLHIQLGLIGVNVAELHSSLTQAQRSESLRRFKTGEVRILIASDLAARGLDIEGIDCIVNMTLPATLAHYIHRVGRTARAGKRGRAISMVGEEERHLLKDIRKAAKGSIHWRVIPTCVIDRYRYRLTDLESTIEKIITEEKAEREIQAATADAERAEARLTADRQAVLSGGEPLLRRKRSWFQTGKEKEVLRDSQKLAQFERQNKGKRGKKMHGDTAKSASGNNRNPGPNERLQHELVKVQQLAKRISKRNGDPSAIVTKKKGAKESADGEPSAKGNKKSAFNVDFNQVNANNNNNNNNSKKQKGGKGGKGDRGGKKHGGAAASSKHKSNTGKPGFKKGPFNNKPRPMTAGRGGKYGKDKKSASKMRKR